MIKKHQTNFLGLFIFIISVFLYACTGANNPTYGPIQEDIFQQAFLESIVDKQQEVIFYSRAIWYPNKNGFKFLPAGKKSRKGIFICTNQAIYFSEWSAKQYQPVLKVEYDQISSLRLAAIELLARVVIKADNYNSFEILGVTGPELPNKEETDIAYQIIEQQKG